jgi:hypothetical protein
MPAHQLAGVVIDRCVEAMREAQYLDASLTSEHVAAATDGCVFFIGKP